MTTTTKTVKSTYHQFEFPNGSTTEARKYVSLSSSRTFNEKQSRVRTLPLYAHPTPLPLQATTSSQSALFKKTWPNGNIETVPYLGHALVHTSFTRPDPNWELNIRKKTEALVTDLSGAVAEFHRTASGFLHFVKLTGNIRRRLKGKGRKINLCEVSSAQLAVQYGIKPVVSDLYAAYGALQSSLNAAEPIFRVASGDSDTMKIDRTFGSFRHVGLYTRSQRATAYFKWKPTADPIKLGNPAEWAWELIPFSFIVDWGLPLGDYIGSFDSLSDVDFVSGTLTTKDRIDIDRIEHIDGDYLSHVDGAASYRSHARTVLNSIPLADFPRFDLGLTVTRVTNALALLHQFSSDC